VPPGLCVPGKRACVGERCWCLSDNFICENPHFVKSALSQYTNWDFIGKVIEHGIAYHERDHGQLFCDDKAKDIVNMLLAECESVGVNIFLQCEITHVSHNDHYALNTNKGIFQAPSLVVATGGLSIPYMNPTPFGYEEPFTKPYCLRIGD